LILFYALGGTNPQTMCRYPPALKPPFTPQTPHSLQQPNITRPPPPIRYSSHTKKEGRPSIEAAPFKHLPENRQHQHNTWFYSHPNLRAALKPTDLKSVCLLPDKLKPSNLKPNSVCWNHVYAAAFLIEANFPVDQCINRVIPTQSHIPRRLLALSRPFLTDP
jgi:hypothetical protein